MFVFNNGFLIIFFMWLTLVTFSRVFLVLFVDQRRSEILNFQNNHSKIHPRILNIDRDMQCDIHERSKLFRYRIPRDGKFRLMIYKEKILISDFCWKTIYMRGNIRCDSKECCDDIIRMFDHLFSPPFSWGIEEKNQH